MKKLLLLTLSLIGVNSFAQVALPNENFDGSVFPPTGWTREITNTTAPDKTWNRPVMPVINGISSAGINYDEFNPQDESLISPVFSLIGFTNAYLNFKVALNYPFMVAPNNNADLIAKVSVDGGLNWTQVWVEEDFGTWTGFKILEIHADLTPYVGSSNVNVKFEYVGQNADIALLDDVSVTGCLPVENVNVVPDTLTDNSFSVSWTGYGSLYDFEWGPVGFTQGTGTASTQEETTFDFDGLNAGTGYSFYIKSDCYGQWQGPFTVYTTLSTPTDLNYSEGFESGPLHAAGWFASASNETYPGQWGRFQDETPFVQDGAYAVECGGSTIDNNAWLFSRGLNLVEGTTVTIQYYLRRYVGAGTGGVNSVYVSIGTTPTPEDQLFVGGIHDDYQPEVFTLESFTYTVPTTGVYYLGFNCVSPAQTQANNGSIIIDTVSVIDPNLSVNEVLSSQFAVYPNPAKNNIRFTNGVNAVVDTIEMTDLNGRIVKSDRINAVEGQVSISDLASGIYMMRISTDQGIAVKKIIKE
ncbi:MAG: T9SS type A sorting domain-containing protein [Flavobacterium sp.]